METKATSLADLVIVITGGTSGIGHATAEALAAEAKGVVVFGRRASQPAALAAIAGMKNVCAVAGDVRSPDDVKRLFSHTLDRFGSIDALIHCAGVFGAGAFLDLPFEQWRGAIATNLFGFALASRAALPHMISRRFGRIVNITSRAAATPAKGTCAYTTSKAAAHLFMRCLALEVQQAGHRNILINDLIPGPTKTGMSPGGQEPAAVVPFIRELILLPESGPTGKTFFQGRVYELFPQR